MARWSRSRLRTVGIGAVALLGGALLIVPAVSGAEVAPATAPELSRPVTTATDRVATVTGAGGRSPFHFKPASGDRSTPFAFVSTGGAVRVQRFGHAAVQAKTGAPAGRSARVAAAATTYRTTFTVASQNWTAWNKTIHLWDRNGWAFVPVTNPANSLSATVNLPPGTYYVASMYGIYGVDSYLLTKAFTVTNKPQTVRLDEASAKEVAVKVDDTTARRDMSAVWMSLPNGDLVGFAGGPRTRTYVTTASLAGTTLRVHEVLVKAGSSALKPSPYRYDLVKSWPHPLPAAPVATVRTASLAKTTTTVRAQGVNTDGSYSTVPMTGEWTGAYLPTTMRFPATVTEYVTPGVTMSRLVHYGADQSLQPADRNLPAGTSPGEAVGAGPLVPSRRAYDDDSRRYRNRLEIIENMTLGDAAGNRGADHSERTTMTLRSGGQVLKTSQTAGLTADVPAAEQTYELEQTSTRKVAWSQLSTSVRSEWTFRSGGPAYATLPLMDLTMAATGLDQRNRAGAAPVRLTVVPSTRRTSATSTVGTVEWSVDDGRTWTEAPLTASGDGVEAVLAVPATAAFVSLRVTARNEEGGALRRTVLRALAGPATGGDETVGRTTITDVRVNGGRAIVFGTSGEGEITATFTASDPSGIAGGGLYLYHGSYNTPDGVQTASTQCAPVNATTATCTASIYFWDIRYSLNSNALAGAWRVAAWASAKDGAGFTDRHGAGSVAVKRATTLTANATPEPVQKGKMVTVTGALTRADWSTWSFKPYAVQPVSLQWAKIRTSTWTTPKRLKTDASGKLKTTVTASLDGSYRFGFAGDTASNAVTSAADYIDVR